MFGKPQCSCLFFTLFCLSYFTLHGLAMNDGQSIINPVGPLFTKEERTMTLAFTESGGISAVDIDVGHRGLYHLEFITLEPNSLLLPLHLHTDMVFYVQSGRGTVSWVGDKERNEMDVERGDVYRLKSGSVFYVRSHPDPAGVRLRIHALFTDIFEENPTMQEAFVTPYSNLSDMVRGFDDMVLQMAFRVSPEVIQRIKSVEAPPSIVPYPKKNETEEEGGGVDNPNWKKNILEALIGGRRGVLAADEDPNKSKKKKETKTFNLFSRKPDFENCNGWSLAVTGKDLHALKGSNIGVFMVNLTKGSMMGPHWNPRANEIAIVMYGQGMVQVVCPGENPPLSSDIGLPKCRNMRFKVKEGDVFVVPRFFPMAQMSFNDDSFVFMGFSTMARKNRPQFLAGKRSVFQTMDPDILAMSFSASNATTVREFLASQEESIILECASCAESAEKQMEAEEEKERQAEEERRREEEEQREEEEAKRREEEKRRQEEEEEKQRKREEEEEQKQREREEEEGRRQEEEEQRRREKEEEEEEQRKREEEEGARRHEEEQQREKEEKEEEEQRRREEEEEEEEQRQREREREEEEERSQEEEKRRQREREREKEEEQRQREEEEEEARGEEEEQRQSERRREEEEERREEEAQRQEEEEEETRREEEEQRQREEEWRGQGGEGEEGEREREEEWEEGQRGGGGGRRRNLWKV